MRNFTLTSLIFLSWKLWLSMLFSQCESYKTNWILEPQNVYTWELYQIKRDLKYMIWNLNVFLYLEMLCIMSKFFPSLNHLFVLHLKFLQVKLTNPNLKLNQLSQNLKIQILLPMVFLLLDPPEISKNQLGVMTIFVLQTNLFCAAMGMKLTVFAALSLLHSNKQINLKLEDKQWMRSLKSWWEMNHGNCPHYQHTLNQLHVDGLI